MLPPLGLIKSFPGLCEGLTRDLKGHRWVLDAEIVCLDANGKPHSAISCSVAPSCFSMPLTQEDQ
jgi:hypothetical protein